MEPRRLRRVRRDGRHEIWDVRIEVMGVADMGDRVFVLGCTDARGRAAGSRPRGGWPAARRCLVA